MALVLEQPVLPKVVITKGADVKTFDPLVPTFDFNLLTADLIDSMDPPTAVSTISIEDTDFVMKNIAKNGALVEVFLSKTSPFPAANRMFLGFIDHRNVKTSWNKAVYTLTIYSVMSRLTHRVINVQRHQKRLANGIDVDTTDTSTDPAEILKYTIQNKNAYPQLDATETIETKDSIDVSGIVSTGIKLPDYVMTLQKASDVAQQMCELGGRMCYIDVASSLRKFVYTNPETISSGHLITDQDPSAVSWPAGKVHFIIGDLEIDEGIEQTDNRLFGIGGDKETLTLNQTTDNAGGSLFGTDRAHQFQPVVDKNIQAIALKLRKVGNPLGPRIKGSIIEDNVDQPTGAVVKSFEIFPADVPATADFVLVAIGEFRINSGKKHWIALERYGDDGSNTIEWRHDNGVAGVSATKTNGAWTVDTTDFKYAMRIYSTTPLLSIAEDSASIAEYLLRENVVFEPNITTVSEMTKLLRGLLQNSKMQKQILTMTIYPADQLLRVGRTARVKHSKWGLDNDFEITKMEYHYNQGIDRNTWNLKATGVRLIP